MSEKKQPDTNTGIDPNRPLFVKVGIDLRKLSGIPESSQHVMIEDGRLPTPKRIGPRTRIMSVEKLMVALDNLEADS